MLGARIRELRLARGLTQAQLAERSGVSRQLVGAVEAGRHLPRVDAAVALARVLDASVEALLADDPAGVVGVIGAAGEGQLVRVARVGDQLVCVQARPVGESWPAVDGVVRDGEVELLDGEPGGGASAVVAGCDPAIGLVERLVEAEAGPGVLTASASSAAAVTALTAGRTHAAVVHGPAGRLPDPPVPVRRWQVARWQVGLAGAPELPLGWVAGALAGERPVVQREAGAGSQAAFERALHAAGHTTAVDGPRASGHLEAARWAHREGVVAVSIEPAALLVGLAFHPLEEHVSELWIATQHLDVVSVRRFTDELFSSRRLHRRLAAIGGYDLSDCGTEVAA